MILDFKKDLYSLDHNIPLRKLYHCGVRGFVYDY